MVLTPAQQRAKDWLGTVGKAGRKACRRAGFRDGTMEALVEAGVAESRLVGIVSPKPYYYQLGTAPDSPDRQRASVGLPPDGSA